MFRTPSARRSVRSTGQSVYEVMLIIACVAMALAVIFAVYEYVAFYQGPTHPYKFEPSATVSPLSKSAAPAPARKMMPPAPAMTPTPAATAAPAPAPTAAPGTTTATTTSG